ncbi:MAG: DUF1800 domain-containing protein [Pseudomonadota bacterium]
MISEATVSAIRFGYGPGGRDVPRDAAGHLARLRRGDRMARRYPTPDLDAAMAAGQAYRTARDATRGGNERADRQARNAIIEMYGSALVGGFARIAETDDPLRERLTWFWADHFTAVPRNLVMRATVPDYIDTAIRPHVTGRFSDMLIAAVTHPLMLIYLDQIASVGPNSPAGLRRGRGLNENLAREVLELHTLGVDGPYSQTDVTQLAELLTGLSGSQGKGFVFRQGIVEPGAETVLGRQYGGGRPSLEPIRAVLEDLAEHPATAAHVARKMAVHFVADDPEPALVGAMERAWRLSGGDLMAVTQAMVTHPAAWDAPLTKVRQPHDFFAAAITALGVSGGELTGLPARNVQRRFVRPLREMGQPFMGAPGPDGWPEAAEHWITPLGLANRIVWAFDASREVVARAGSAEDFMERALGDAASGMLRFAVESAETREEAAALVLASPEFNRR